MKKIQMMFLLLLLPLLLAACGSGETESTEAETSESLTESADESEEDVFVFPDIEGIDESAKTALLDAVEEYMVQTSLAQEITLTVDSDGEEVVTEMTFVTIWDGTDGELAACGTVTTSETVVETNIYYTQGILYTDLGNIGTKKSSDYSKALSEVELVSEVTDLLTTDFLTAAAKETAEDGSLEISFLVETGDEEMQAGGGIIIVDPDGMLSSLNVCLIWNVEDEETILILDLIVTGFGEDVSITFPDFSSYTLEESGTETESETEIETGTESELEAEDVSETESGT